MRGWGFTLRVHGHYWTKGTGKHSQPNGGCDGFGGGVWVVRLGSIAERG